MDRTRPKPVRKSEKKQPAPAAEKPYRTKFTEDQTREYYKAWDEYKKGTLINPRDGKRVTLYIVAKGVAYARAMAITTSGGQAESQTPESTQEAES